MDDKSLIRARMRSIKKTLTAEQIEENSRLVCEKLRGVPEFNQRKRLFIYISYNQEIITTKLIRKELDSGGHSIFVPKVIGDRRMRFCKINNMDSGLERGAYGILEPVSDSFISDDEICDSDSLIILPGLAFDTEFNRIGYGGGYYDTFLEKHKRMFKIAVCHDFQIIDKAIRPEPTDVKADMIISERRIYRHGG